MHDVDCTLCSYELVVWSVWSVRTIIILPTGHKYKLYVLHLPGTGDGISNPAKYPKPLTLKPPSMLMHWPVTYPAAREHKNATTPETSSTWPTRNMGVLRSHNTAKHRCVRCKQ